MTENIEYVDFDELDLPLADAESVRAQITRSAQRLHAQGNLRIHFAKHQHPGAKPKFSIHLFFEHDGHKHTSDKHHGWDLADVLKQGFEALETQLEREHA